jgi:hypothetical protein
MNVCRHKPNENFPKKGIFISKPKGLGYKCSHENELSYALEALFQNQRRKSLKT